MPFASFFKQLLLGITGMLIIAIGTPHIPTSADSIPIFEVGSSPSPMVEENYVTLDVWQINGSWYTGQAEVYCASPINAASIFDINGQITNGIGSFPGFAQSVSFYTSSSTLQMDCYVYYYNGAIKLQPQTSTRLTERQMQPGDSIYRGGEGGMHVTICTNWSGVPYGQPCSPPLPTPVSPALQTPGVYAPSTGEFFLKNYPGVGAADTAFVYGPPNSVPLVGDWTGNGHDTVGVYIPATGTFFLRNSNSPGMADIAFTYGPPNAVPLVGDWTGSGHDSIGVYVPSTGMFFLRKSNSSGVADTTFNYGPANGNFVPLVGNWTGNGHDSIGIYDGSTGTFFLRNSNTSGAADTTFVYGPSSANVTPLVGDWTKSGYETVGIDISSTATFYLRDSNSEGTFDSTFSYGPVNTTPLVGHWA